MLGAIIGDIVDSCYKFKGILTLKIRSNEKQKRL